MAFMFEKREVYQTAVSLADQIAELTQNFPRGFGFRADQANRAALSIATNLAEGNGRFTKPDRRNFFTIARGSMQECVPLWWRNSQFGVSTPPLRSRRRRCRR